MARSIQIASVFTAIGFKVEKKDLDRLQKQLVNLKKQIAGLSNVKVGLDFNLNEVKRARGELEKISKIAHEIPRNISVAVRQTGITSAAGRTRQAVSAGRGAFVGGALGSQLGQFAPGVGGVGAAFFGGANVLQTGQQLEAIRAGLTAAAGSAEAGAREFQFMVDLSERLGINFQDNVRAYQNFIAAGESLNFGIDKSREVFTATASAARVLGLSAADTNGVMRAMTQILSKGTVQAEELRGQLGERLPGAVGMMAKAIGVSVEELNKMLENGEVISKDALPKMADAMIEFANTAGALDKAVNSNLANQERLANAWFFFKARIAESGFMDQMTNTFVTFAKVLNDNNDLAEGIGKTFEFLAKVLKAVGTVTVDLFKVFSALPSEMKLVLLLITLLSFHFTRIASLIITVVAVLEDFFDMLRGEDSVIGTFLEKATLMQKAFALLATGMLAILLIVKAKRFFSAFLGGFTGSRFTTATDNIGKMTGKLNALKLAMKGVSAVAIVGAASEGLEALGVGKLAPNGEEDFGEKFRQSILSKITLGAVDDPFSQGRPELRPRQEGESRDIRIFVSSSPGLEVTASESDGS